MFELPEYVTLSRQINEAMQGKVIEKGRLGNSPHKFVWYNRSEQEFEELTRGKSIGPATSRGRWMSVPLEPDYVLLLGECGGKMLFHEAGTKLPKKYHLHLQFEDGTFFTVTTQMWGAMELYPAGEEQNREFVKDMRMTPMDEEFTFGYFDSLIDKLVEGKKRSAKSLLTQDQILPGLGNAIAQDILFRSNIHPKRPIGDLDTGGRRKLYDAIRSTVSEVIDAGGRNDEFDLFGHRGGYIRLMDKNAAGEPCPECGTAVQRIQYLGGACYFCPSCQRLNGNA